MVRQLIGTLTIMIFWFQSSATEQSLHIVELIKGYVNSIDSPSVVQAWEDGMWSEMEPHIFQYIVNRILVTSVPDGCIVAG